MSLNPRAFPIASTDPDANVNFGMTLRDWFAGQALTGLVASIPGPGCADWGYYSGAAYAIADAMLADRASTLPSAPSGEAGEGRS